MHSHRNHGPGGAKIEHGHRTDRFLALPRGYRTRFDRGRDHASADWLGENKFVTGLATHIAYDPFRVHDADGGHAVLDLGVIYRVAAKYGHTSLSRLINTTADDLAKLLQR